MSYTVFIRVSTRDAHLILGSQRMGVGGGGGTLIRGKRSFEGGAH